MAPFVFRHRNPDGSLDTNTTQKVVAVYLTIGLFIFLGVGAFLSTIKQWRSNGAVSLEPPDGWLTVLAYVLTFLAAWLGIAGGVTIGKRFSAKADVIEVNARSLSGVSATPPPVPGKNIPRNSVGMPQEAPAIRAPTERRSWLEGDDDRPKLTDNDAGIL